VDRDVHFKKDVVLEYQGHSIRLRVAQDLFSSFEIDAGTRMLLRSLAESDTGRFRKVLDLGCGYGPLGLALKAADPGRQVHMVDRDALAVEYTRQNATLNGLTGVQTYGSLGYDDVPDRDFDLIVSNIPGKAGDAVLSHLLLDAALHLKPGGLLAVVVVAPIAPAIEGTLGSAPNGEVVFRKATRSYVVAHCRFNPPDPRPELAAGGFDRGVYHRNDLQVDIEDAAYALETAYGLPEFDSAGFQSELLIAAARGLRGPAVERALFLNPGQGHVPVAIWKLLKPRSIDLVDRDLLGLRYGRKNLALNGCPGGQVTTSHQVGVVADGDQRYDLVAGVLRESEGSAYHSLMLEQAAPMVSGRGRVIVAASSTAVTRLVKQLRPPAPLRVQKRRRKKGNAVLLLAPPPRRLSARGSRMTAAPWTAIP
jgi:16S rRNA (guanine1207-N2)-methyltransferase